ncbi:Six-hairpin glycosidase-like protein [Dactylonectria estremocensis]|uniref:Six-hairpin glycosidase-like protein n=1 Tax=Dactylonectria estremocensis TaxID=1079267 RepID=A0A9P9DTS8_9HYPO|nr:Six-hairpin glycosidase-like protein [Dactylonectria estremocensis]
MSIFKTLLWLLPLTLTSAAVVDGRSHGNYDSQAIFHPVGIAVGTGHSSQSSDVKPFKLNSASSFATIDYGTERAGWPFFDVAKVDRPVQIEVKYSEAFYDLQVSGSDGPFPFNVGQANTFRVETFNITKPGRYSSFLLQGGQRWQSIQLLTAGTITFSNVGLDASIGTAQPDELPGKFSSSDDVLNDIWSLGARGTIASCLDKGSQRAVWKVDSKKGVRITNQRPAQTTKAIAFTSYTLEFDAFIERGGLWWSVAHSFGILGGLHLQLVGELPRGKTFANTNTTLTPANTISLAKGYAFVNQTTVTSYFLDTFKVPFSVKENTWYRIKTVLDPDGFLSVFINKKLVFKATLADYYVGGGSISQTGSFGFGAWQDHVAYFRNVVVTDTTNGSTLYKNSLKGQEVLAEYGTGPNLASVCLDGPKRDRLVWLGDFYHTARIIGASTGRFDHSTGTLDFLLKSQIDNGQLSINPNLGYDPSIASAFAPTGSYFLDDYQALGFLSFYHYMRHTNDVEYGRKTWAQWQKQLDWLLGKISSTDGLVHFGSAFLGGADAGSAVSCVSTETIYAAADIATAIGKKNVAAKLRKSANALADAINDKLWNTATGTYSLSTSDKSAFTVAGTAFCITAGIATKKQVLSAVSALDGLQLGFGYKDSSNDDPESTDLNISPNTNGFLLPAILAAKDWKRASELIYGLWGAMTANPETNTGASWEYITPQGEPGLGAYTSLGHPWGGAATYVLTEWVAGLRTASGVDGFGYKNWIVGPDLGVYMGLEHAGATVPLFPSGHISVNWKISKGGRMSVEVRAPKTTKGVFKLGNTKKILEGKSKYSFTIQTHS